MNSDAENSSSEEAQEKKENSPEVTAFLRERYGNVGGRKATLSGWKLPALIFAIIGGSWLLWSANHASHPEIRTTLISFSATSAGKMELRYSIDLKNPLASHQCTLVARDRDMNTVGEIIDHLPLGHTHLTRSVTIPTRLQAVNTAVTSCASL